MTILRIIAATAVLTFAAQGLAVPQDSLIVRALEQTMFPDYDGALATLDRVIALDPAGPQGYFFKAVVYHSMVIDYEDWRFEPDFEKYAHMAQQRLAQLAAPTPMDYFVSGTLDGYRGALAVKKGNWFTGFRYGRRGVEAVRRTLALDPGFADAQWCVGAYEFYWSKMTSQFAWLPFVEDRREEAIRKIKVAMTNGHYCRVAAQHSLAWILYGEQRYAEALALAEDLSARYPRNRMFLWTVADCRYALEQWRPAQEAYRELLARTEADKFDNHYNAAVCRWKLANIHYRFKEYSQAADECQKILQYHLDKDVAERLADRLERTRSLLDRIHQAQKQAAEK
jgi:tetratricopeptide (TPR) repeat protein